MSTSSTSRCSVREACEDVERRLLLPRSSEEAGLPPDSEVCVVAKHEPHHQVDARVRTSDRKRLTHVSRLSGERDAEECIGWACLPAVLGDPDALLAPKLVHGSDERVDVSESHSASARLAGGCLARLSVVRMVGVRVEVPEPGTLGESHEWDRRQRGPARARRVVPTRPGSPTGDLLAGEVREVDALPDRIADTGIRPRARAPPAGG